MTSLLAEFVDGVVRSSPPRRAGRRGRTPILVAVTVSLALTACHGRTSRYAAYEDSAVKVDLTKLTPPMQVADRAAVAAASIAYSYSYSLVAPPSAIAGLMRRHQAACASAGPTVCQLLDSSLNERAEGTDGTLNLRATPAWLARFRSGVEADARSVGGRVAQSTTSAEDLSRTVVDTEASVRAQTTLRDRLQALLADRPGRLEELVDLEKQLAQVQGQLDATTSELAELNGRVQMSKLTLNYAPPFGMRDTADRPLHLAVAGFRGEIELSVAALITVFAALLPWLALALAGAIVWIAIARRRGRRAASVDRPLTSSPST